MGKATPWSIRGADLHDKTHLGGEASDGAAHASAESWPPAGRAWFAVLLLMGALFMSTIDRSILALLVDPIKRSLHLSDTRIGLLQGAAFGLFFMLMTFPAGWLADRSNRMRVVAWGVALWSIVTALCGLCSSFTQLFMARMGVAVGEAALQPAAPSVIADYFAPERRALPLSCYLVGAGMGAGVSLLAGGFVAGLVGRLHTAAVPVLAAFEPWQIIFFAVGLPGLLVSLLLCFAREPPRREQQRTEGTLHELLQALRARRAVLIPHFAGVCLYQIYTYGYVAWMPAYFMRRHGWTMIDVGLRYGVVQLTFPMAGAWAGGVLSRSLWRRGRRNANLLTGALCFGAMTLPAILGTLAPSAWASALLLGLAMACAQAPAGANTAAIQEIFPNRLRGRVTALYYASIALSGMTGGPLMIGLLNDHVFRSATGVGSSMSLTALLTLPLASALLFIAARRRMRLDSIN